MKLPCVVRAHARALLAISGVLSMLALSVPAISAEIFKCVAKDGTALYQNFPCEFDSIGWVPSNPQTGKTTLMPGASQATPKAAPVNVAPVNVASTVKSTYTGEIRIGMTSDEVLALLGKPEEMVDDEPESGRVSNWRYADGRIVQFDHKHQVVGVQR